MSNLGPPRTPRPARRAAAARWALPLFALAACAPPPVPEGAVASTEPSIRITWPPAETPVQGCEIVTVEVENFDFVAFPTEEDVEGQGHYHVYHPGGYAACYKPWCFVDFSSVASTTEPYLVAVLASNQHDELVDEDGNPVEDRVPIEFVPGACGIGAPDDTDTGGGDTAGDTGGAG